ncbi:Short-chain dehydrogenase [Taphrina deformans PYCC 5710]|uniref:Short-chain dehydrogenase n=1 Tax=Taphrina deformans (strain PYCC 5710 / ATCC 11124 / CBS 356.35 / IMI 108563 / JCM 9778 / NBRC 8474) TaxID=1097556 RepID=R4XEQ3_TAPDE|nr:Short-chain dehydrogenase [Taphrina deformans PYCC 5710]|eukprot:CCG81847.1 Short-chain dehydrogenase [Taphrina deformans PYCC 5710]
MAAELQLDSLFSVKERVALVTGGGSGIGLMCARALAANGAKVYIVGRTEEKLEVSAKEHGEGLSGQLIPIVADITKKSELEKLVKEIESKEKCLCILVNNAGISGTSEGPQSTNASGGTEGSPEGETAQELKDNLWGAKDDFDTWTDIYRTNVAALYYTSVAFLPLLESASKHHHGYSGTIINITSISGLTKQAQNHFAYNSSKGAAIHLNEMLATELANNGIKIRVNSIAPGVYPSEMTAKESDDKNQSQLEKKEFQGIPAKRPGHERDMANACIFLATNQYLNGVTVPVDGGWLLVN